MVQYSLRQRKPERSLGRTAQDGHLDSHTAPELYAYLAEGCSITIYTEEVLFCFESEYE